MMNDLENTYAAVIKARGWLDKANCKNMDTNLFFPEAGHTLLPFVKELCDSCPVQEDCLWYANETYSDMGVFAGMGARERQSWRVKNKVQLGMSKQDWEETMVRRPIGGQR